MTDDNELLELAGRAESLMSEPDAEDCERFLSWYGTDLISGVRRLISEKRSEAARADLTGFMLAWVAAYHRNFSGDLAKTLAGVELDEAQAPQPPRIIEPVTPETVFRAGDRVRWFGTEKWVGIRNITKAGNVMLSNRYLFRKDQMAQSFDRIERAPQ